MKKRHFLVAVIFSTLSSSAVIVPASAFSLSDVINPGADSDSGRDFDHSLVTDRLSTQHIVWVSDVDHTGSSGGDSDIFYSSNSGTGWNAPILVNSYGTSDSATETAPDLALSLSGVLHCVWDSDMDTAGAGTDLDIFHSQNPGSGWSAAELVNTTATVDNPAISNQDDSPAISLASGEIVTVVWSSSFDQIVSGNPPGPIGMDSDILMAQRVGGVWNPPEAVNTDASSDGGGDGDWSPALAIAPGGDLVVGWSSNSPDPDIHWSQKPVNGAWAEAERVSAQGILDGGDDNNVSLAIVGSGANAEYHFVWESNDSHGTSGGDYDIFHAVRGPNTFLGPPTNDTFLVNSSATTDAGTEDDRDPILSVEPGGVLHCTWESEHDFTLLPGIQTGGDWDIFHSTNATGGGEWSPLDVVNTTAWDDHSIGLSDSDRDPQIACAPNGLVTVAWETTYDQILGGAPNIGIEGDLAGALGFGRFVTRPELINMDGASDSGASDPVDFSVRLAVSPSGTVHAVWSSGNRFIGSGTTDDDRDIFHASLGLTGWSEAHLVNSNGNADLTGDYDPFIAVDDQGTLHVIWVSSEGIGGTGQDGDLFYATSGDSGLTWTAPELANTTGTSDDPTAGTGDYEQFPQIVVADDGTVHAVWDGTIDTLFSPPIPDSQFPNIFYASRTASGWGSPELVNETYARTVLGWDLVPQLLLDGTGVPVVLWESEVDYLGAGSDRDIFFTSRAGGSWSAPQFVNSAASDGTSLDGNTAASFAPDGTLHAVWGSDVDIQGAGADRDLIHNSRSGASWSTPGLLTDLGRSLLDVLSDDFQPSIAFDTAGMLHVVWVSNYPFIGTAGVDEDIFYVVINPADPNPSTAPIILANPSGHGDPGGAGSFATERLPQLVIDNFGRTHFAWQSEETLGGVVGSDLDIFHTRTLLPLLTKAQQVLEHLLRGTSYDHDLDFNIDGATDVADLVHALANP